MSAAVDCKTNGLTVGQKELVCKGQAYLELAGHQRPLHRRLVRHHGLAGDYDVEVLSIESGGPADTAGLRVGDVIVEANEQPVSSIDDLHRYLSEWPIGRPVDIIVIRATMKRNLTVLPTEAVN